MVMRSNAVAYVMRMGFGMSLLLLGIMVMVTVKRRLTEETESAVLEVLKELHENKTQSNAEQCNETVECPSGYSCLEQVCAVA